MFNELRRVLLAFLLVFFGLVKRNAVWLDGFDVSDETEETVKNNLTVLCEWVSGNVEDVGPPPLYKEWKKLSQSILILHKQITPAMATEKPNGSGYIELCVFNCMNEGREGVGAGIHAPFRRL